MYRNPAINHVQPQCKFPNEAAVSAVTSARNDSAPTLTLTSRQISRCFSAKCMAWSWFPSAVCAFPRLQHARPSPILQTQQKPTSARRITSTISVRAAQSRPVVQVLGNDEMLEVVVDGSLIVLQERVGVAQTVAGLGLHSSVLQLPRQLQRPPAGTPHTLPSSDNRSRLALGHRTGKN